MSRPLSNISLVLLIALLMAGSILAQGQQGNTTDRLRQQLEQTDQLIDRAREAVHASKSPAAKVSLDAALSYQEQAWNAYHNDYLQTSGRLTVKARMQAQKAISAGRLTEQNEDAVLRKLEQVKEMFEKAREYQSMQPGEGYEAVLRNARDNLDRAWEFYRSSQYRAAVMLANQAEKALRKLTMDSSRSVRTRMNYERRSQNIESVINDAADRMAGCSRDEALSLLERARETYRRAEDLAVENRYGAGMTALLKARDMAQKAARMCRGADGDKLENRRVRYQAELDRLSENLSPSDATGTGLKSMVQEQLRLAQEALQEGRREAAAAALKGAEQTLKQLRRHFMEQNG